MKLQPGGYLGQESMMKFLVRLASLCLAMALTLDAYAQNTPNPLTGKRLYRAYCFVCHGADGNSNGPLATKLNLKPADLSSAQ